MSLGFILSRYVITKKTNNYWKECINQIRKFYPLNEIIIVDDNSNYDFIDDENVDLTNTKVIQSVYPQRAELLPYYYFYKLKPFDTAVILSDSTFIRSKLVDENTSDDVRFLWCFDSYLKYKVHLEMNVLKHLNYSGELIELYNNEHMWRGCFSVLSVIKYDFIVRLVEKYNFFILLDHIKCRDDRMFLERAFAVLCYNEDKSLVNKSSLFGNIIDKHWRMVDEYSYDDYINDKQNNRLENYKIIRVWTGR